MCGKRGWQDQIEKLIGQIWRESCVEKLYRTIQLTIVWKNLMTNLGDKFTVIFFNWCNFVLNILVDKFSVKMGGQIGHKYE